MAKTVAGKISGVLNRKTFFQLWMCIAWNWWDPVKNFLLISKDISFIIKMVWSLFELFQKKSPKPCPEKTGVTYLISNLRLWMCIAWNCRFLVKLLLLIFKDNLFINQRLSRACIVHLVIKKTNWSYVKTMSCVILELRST
jgi:hypothetical protein